jgi:multidrug efflux pump subunit AcrA (membrane-fusion protein)
MLLNSRLVRILVGLALLAVGILAVLPTITGYTSLDGTVNARIAIISAPIEGTVLNTPPKVGTPFPEGQTLLSIQNERINRAVVGTLSGELEAARQRLLALDSQRQQLARLRDDLSKRLTSYQQASIRAVEQEIAVMQQRIGINRAQQQAADAELQRRASLGQSGIVAGSQVEQARAGQATTVGEGRVAAADLERLNRQLESLKSGVFVGDGRNDVPYSRQRQDEITIQLTEIDTRLKETEARVHQIENQLGSGLITSS